MQLLERKIAQEGTVKPGQILKVDNFLNHQIDITFLAEVGKEFHRLFKDADVTKILTIEASGIAIAAMTAQCFGVPMLFAKKVQTKNIDGDVYTSKVVSYTHGTEYTIRVSKKFLTPQDRVLIVDDFLAKGAALEGLCDIVRQSGATLVGAGIVIEKGFQEGGSRLRAQGLRLESLAIIDSMDEEKITFR